MDDNEAKADHGMAILDALADRWAAETDLTATIKNAVSPMRLNRNTPDDVRDGFTHRMEVQIDAIARQAFIEGAYRAITGLQDDRAEMVRQGIEMPCTCGRMKTPSGQCIHDISLNAICDECWGEEIDKHPIHTPRGSR